MRKLIYVVFGLMIFTGAAGLLYNRQMRVVDDAGPGIASETDGGTERGVTGRGLDRPEALQKRQAQRAERRIDRGLRQYRTPSGNWQTFEAVVDVLNVVVGLVGIGLAVSGMRMRRANSGARNNA
ncbi:MAG: hypothetical protein ACT4N2_13715 [Hyphomicrobium sp.]